MSSKHPIDSLFEKELKEHQIKPSDKVWEKVAASQQGAKPKREGWLMLRAAAVALLIGISSLIYYNRNASELDLNNIGDTDQSWVAGPETTPNTKNDEPKSSVKTEDPKKEEPKAKTNQKTPAKKPKKTGARVIPVLQQTISEPILAFNDLGEVDSDLPLEAAEDIDNPEVYKVRVQLPKLNGATYSTEKKSKDLGERMWAYASDQYERVKSGEFIELPKAENTKIEIPLPDFINRRFNK